MHHGPETLIDDIFFDIDTSAIRQALLGFVTIEWPTDQSTDIVDDAEPAQIPIAAHHADIWNQDF